MADLSQRPLIPIGVGPRATEQPSDAGRRSPGDDPAAAVPTGTDGDRVLDDLSVTGVPPRESAIARDDASLEAAIEALARDAALLREAVARFDITGRPVDADAVPPDDAPLLDTLVAAQAREQRVRDDTVELTRGLARITTQSALLLVKFTDSAAAFLGRLAASGEAPAPAARRRLAPWIATGAALVGIAAIVSALALLQARENARQVERLQQALVQSIRDNAQAQEAAVRTLEARVRELTAHEAALVAAIQAAIPAPPHAAEPEAALRREPAKPAAPTRNAKRKAAR